jgi:hypothetical protein
MGWFIGFAGACETNEPTHQIHFNQVWLNRCTFATMKQSIFFTNSLLLTLLSLGTMEWANEKK